MYSLRAFLDQVRRHRPRDVLEVRREVDPRYETAAILTRLEQKHRSPILYFHRVRGSRWPVVTNVCGSIGRLALALDCPIHELSERYSAACRRPIEPVVEREGPVQHTVLEGPEVDLGLLPRMVYHENDADAGYLTAAMVAARDPVTGKTNVSYHRLMLVDRHRTALFMEHGHLLAIYREYAEAGEAMPVAVFIGAHPLWSIGAVYSGSPEVEEYGVIGGLQREPLRLVETVSQPGLRVPAEAELVLEGHVPPDERVEEGPFGEFTGVSTGTTRAPVFHVRAMTFREDPVLQDIVSGHLEHLTLPALTQEARLLEIARRAAPGVTRVAMPAPLTVLVALEKTDDLEPGRIIEAVLEEHVYAKHVLVVDAGVDLADPRQLATAIALNVQADRDVVVMPGRQGSFCDPSCDPVDGSTAKMGVDATMPLAAAGRTARNRVPREVLDAVDLEELLGCGERKP
jgi:UbiD family decarboxylase